MGRPFTTPGNCSNTHNQRWNEQTECGTGKPLYMVFSSQDAKRYTKLGSTRDQQVQQDSWMGHVYNGGKWGRVGGGWHGYTYFNN